MSVIYKSKYQSYLYEQWFGHYDHDCMNSDLVIMTMIVWTVIWSWWPWLYEQWFGHYDHDCMNSDLVIMTMIVWTVIWSLWPWLYEESFGHYDHDCMNSDLVIMTMIVWTVIWSLWPWWQESVNRSRMSERAGRGEAECWIQSLDEVGKRSPRGSDGGDKNHSLISLNLCPPLL